MRWIALLRGVNVGGANRLAMADLRATCASIGLERVRSHIQSGNVVADDPTRSEGELVADLRSAIHADHGLDVGVVVRSSGDWRRIATAHPDADREIDPKFLHVWLLDRAPDPAAAAEVDPRRFEPDRWVLDGREVYVTYPGGSARSKLTLDVLERPLGVTATGRNLNTVRTLLDLLDE